MPIISKPTGILQAPITTIERFANKFQINEETGCWDWITTTNFGYGYYVLHQNGKFYNRRAHRMMYELVTGVPLGTDNLILDHLCTNKACINPKHMELVTNAENVRRGLKTRGTTPKLPGMWTLRGHCKFGHKFTPENTLKRGVKRYCRTCNPQWRLRKDRDEALRW